jgi:hypothetical protein
MSVETSRWLPILLRFRRFLRRTDGFVLTTESVLWTTLTVCALVVGLAAVRTAILFLFVDAAEALASRENGFVFDPVVPNGLVMQRIYPNPPGTFPTVGDLIPPADRPAPVAPTPE